MLAIGRAPMVNLIGFDIAGVVVALHLEDRRLAIANVHHAGIFAGAANHLRTSGRQLHQVDLGGFIGAMLRPHDREYAQFRQVRLAADRLQDAVIFFRAEAMFGDDFRGDLGSGAGHAAPLAAAWAESNGGVHALVDMR